MRVCIKKIGSYSFSPTGSPMTVLTFEDLGEIRSFEDSQAKMLIRDGWAELISENDLEDFDEPVVEKKQEPEVEEDQDEEKVEQPQEFSKDEIEVYLNKLIEGKEEAEQKQVLQDWGMLNLEHKVSKSKKPNNMITELISLVD